MGKKFRNLLTILIATLGLVVLIFVSQSTPVKAATHYETNSSDNGLLSGMKITQKDYGTASDIQLTLDWDATGKDLANGDTWTIALPDNLKVRDAGTQFPIIDDLGNTLGTATLNADNTISVTFTDLTDQTDFKGSLNIGNGVIPSSKANIGNNDVQIGTFNDNMTIITSDADFSKKGVLGTDENGESIITWTILANRNSSNFPNLTITDNINSDQTYIPGSLTVHEASWKSEGFYKKGNAVTDFTLNETGNGFEISNLPKDDQFYAVTFQTKVNDSANATNGYKFKNHADFTWSGGSNGTLNKGFADTNVSGKPNTGNGNGNDVTGTVTLTKKSTEDDSLLDGAVYELYKKNADGTETLIGSDYTTVNGTFTVPNLTTGNYYFKEIKAPDDYQINQLEVPFTIDKNNQAVQVNTKDTLDTRIHVGNVAVMKVDAETKHPLAGAVFEVLNANGERVGDTVTTDRNGIVNFYDLPVGRYTLREVKSPEGYVSSGKDIHFEITEKDLTPDLISVENEKASVFDESYMVDLQKLDKDDLQTPVAGAEYTLYTSDGNLVETKVTDSNGMINISGLKPGNYYFVETKSPAGYALNNEEFHFEITDKDVIGTIKAYDKRNDEGGTGEPGGEKPGTEEPENPNPENPDPEKPSVVEPGDNNNGNEDNNNNNNGNEDNNGGVIVDPENPNSGDNNSNNNGGGIITNPVNPDNTNNGNSSSSNSTDTLPQTGAKSGLAASLIGLIILSGLVYNKRRHA